LLCIEEPPSLFAFCCHAATETLFAFIGTPLPTFLSNIPFFASEELLLFYLVPLEGSARRGRAFVLTRGCGRNTVARPIDSRG
jgi:hypothetical protein